MSENKTKPTNVKVNDFLTTVSIKRQQEAGLLIDIMKEISGDQPVLWGPSIIGFGSRHYKYDTGREGDMPRLSFSPRKASISIYFIEGFNQYSDKLKKLGKFKNSISCLYVNKLSEIDLDILKSMLRESYQNLDSSKLKITTVQQYIDNVPSLSRSAFDELRRIVIGAVPYVNEVLSYGVVGYKIDDKRARVFISGWKDHLAMYPVPKDPKLVTELKPYIKSKGTLWFPLDKDLPRELMIKTVNALIKN